MARVDSARGRRSLAQGAPSWISTARVASMVRWIWGRVESLGISEERLEALHEPDGVGAVGRDVEDGDAGLAIGGDPVLDEALGADQRRLLQQLGGGGGRG